MTKIFRTGLLVLLYFFSLLGHFAWADDETVLDASLESTIKLIKSMVNHGALPQDKADAMIREAKQQAELAKVAAVKANEELRAQIKREVLAEVKGQMIEDIRRQVTAELARGGSSPTVIDTPSADAASLSTTGVPGINAAEATAKPRVVRVPYIPEATKREMREQIKQEVLAQAKEERWGNPDTLPDWLDRLSFAGDIRLRYDSFKLDPNNTPAGTANYVSGTGLTRGADLVGVNGTLSGAPNVNTQEDFSRFRLRARFGVNARLSDTVSAGLSVATGSVTGPITTNQTLGQNFREYALWLDKGFITLKPTPWLSFTGGRFDNPYLSTDLVWAQDLNFEGVALSLTPRITPDISAFITAGWFPLRANNPLQSASRDMTGVQGGLDWQLWGASNLKLGAALYNYSGVEGQVESNVRYGPPSASDYGTLYEYPAGLRQRGNTLFIVNALNDPATTTTYWGLASGFRELDLTGTLDLATFDPVHVVLTGDFVKNLAFSRSKIAQVTGSQITDGKDYGYLGKLLVGQPAMANAGDWNVSLTYRWLGSDAVLDAFTNGDFGMGSTNNKGYILGGNYGIAKNTWVSAKWMSSDLIDSMAPVVAGSTASPTKLSVDLLEIDLNAKF